MFAVVLSQNITFKSNQIIMFKYTNVEMFIFSNIINTYDENAVFEIIKTII